MGEDWIVERLLVELAPLPRCPRRQGAWQRAPLGWSAAAIPACAPTTPLWLGEAAGWRPVPLWQRSQLQPQQRLAGPALVVDATTTTVLEPGWQALVLADGALLLERAGCGGRRRGWPGLVIRLLKLWSRGPIPPCLSSTTTALPPLPSRWGAAAAERPLGEYPRAARFLLRPLRCARASW